MKLKISGGLILVLLLVSRSLADDSPWQTIFDGKSLDGWKAADHDECFTVKEGLLVAGGGPMAHLFYVGPVGNHDFKNFELRAEVKTTPRSNSGIFFHTQPQSGFLKQGYEAQICNNCVDKRRTGSLLIVKDILDTSPVKDDEWFEYHVLVSGKRIVLKVNGQTTVDYTEPENPERPKGRERRVLSHGQIALQAHDPDSIVYYRNIRVKVLPE